MALLKAIYILGV